MSFRQYRMYVIMHWGMCREFPLNKLMMAEEACPGFSIVGLFTVIAPKCIPSLCI